MIKYPRLLDAVFEDGVLKEKGRFHPLNLSLTMNLLPLSTASMTIPEDDPEVRVHDLVELFNQHGSVGIYRVSSISQNYKHQRVVELNHGLDLLNDSFYVHTGGQEKFSGTVAAFLQKILAVQQQGINGVYYWQLGTCADTGTWTTKLEFNNCLELISDVAKKREDYYFTYDFSTWPWTLNVVARDYQIMSEFRLSRNIESCNVTMDDSGLCTKLYLSVATTATVTETNASGQSQTAGDKTTNAYYTYEDAAGIANYGVVCETAGVNAADLAGGTDTEAGRDAWVSAYFERHNTPTVQITISGEDLKELTGEPVDEVHLGRICRVALPEYSDTFMERVTTVTYPDVYRKPTYVNVSLANKRNTTEDAIAAYKKEQTKSGGGGGGSSSKKNQQLSENTETEVERQKIINNVNVTKSDTKFEVLATTEEWNALIQQYQTTHKSKFTLTSEEISSSVSSAVSTAKSEIKQTTDSISAKVTTNENNISQLLIDVNGITLTGETITIKGTTLDLGSTFVKATNIQAEYLDAIEGEIDNIITGVTQATAIVTSSLQTDSLALGSYSMSGHSISMGTTNKGTVASTAAIDMDHYHGIECSENNGVITIKLKASQSTEGSDSFNMAATQFYQDAVAAAEASGRTTGADSVTLSSAGWVNGQNVVTAASSYFSGTAPSETISLPAFTVSGGGAIPSGSTSRTVTFSTASVQNPLATATVDASNVYTDGVTAGEGHFSAATVTDVTVTPIGTTAYTATYKSRTLQGTQTTVTVPSGNTYSGVTSCTFPFGSSTWKTLYQKLSDGTYESVGYHIWHYGGTARSNMYVSTTTETYYTAGSPAVFYDIGYPGTYYKAGTTATYHTVDSDTGYYTKTT